MGGFHSRQGRRVDGQRRYLSRRKELGISFSNTPHVGRGHPDKPRCLLREDAPRSGSGPRLTAPCFCLFRGLHLDFGPSPFSMLRDVAINSPGLLYPAELPPPYEAVVGPAPGSQVRPGPTRQPGPRKPAGVGLLAPRWGAAGSEPPGAAAGPGGPAPTPVLPARPLQTWPSVTLASLSGDAAQQLPARLPIVGLGPGATHPGTPVRRRHLLWRQREQSGPRVLPPAGRPPGRRRL